MMCKQRKSNNIFVAVSAGEWANCARNVGWSHSATTNWGALNQPHYFSQTHLWTDQIFAFLAFTLLCLVCMIAWFSPLNCKRYLLIKFNSNFWEENGWEATKVQIMSLNIITNSPFLNSILFWSSCWLGPWPGNIQIGPALILIPLWPSSWSRAAYALSQPWGGGAFSSRQK